MIRAFIAVELDAPLRQALEDIQSTVKAEVGRGTKDRDVRLQWVKPDAMHVTLKFLGDLDEQHVEPVAEAVRTVAGATSVFEVPVHGLGVFPDLRAPRVLWVGLHEPGAQTLTACAAALDAALEPLGIEGERRPFSGHLTLARIKDGGRDVGRALRDSGLLASSQAAGTLRVDAIALMRSELRPGGSVYTRLATAPLRARAH